VSRVAVIRFPGSNCERETLAALKANGLDTEMLQWNCSEDTFSQYDAYILPGGFAYQDRIRAGVIASKLPIMPLLQKANDAEKPILGICNGCQILAESGLIPDVAGKQEVEVALAPNQNKDTPIGFICDWTFVRIRNPNQNVFLKGFSNNPILPIPINHGEGRFIFKTNKETHFSDLAHLNYCSDKGDLSSSFPTNPNASTWNIAGIGNKRGNVLALMPHPERAAFLKQIPGWIQSPWTSQKQLDGYDGNTKGPWAPLFQALCTKN